MSEQDRTPGVVEGVAYGDAPAHGDEARHADTPAAIWRGAALVFGALALILLKVIFTPPKPHRDD